MANREFSERTYEFCFNAEFSEKNKSILATLPFLPSQKQEKGLGYDVNFKIQNEYYCYSLFLQHKVPSFAQYRMGKNNAQFFDSHNGAYFRFAVDNDQHNNMVKLSLIGDVYYCAPLFNTYKSLEFNYQHKSVINNSAWIHPGSIKIIDGKRHSITFNPKGTVAILHSNPKKLEIISPNNLNLTKVKIDMQFIENLANELELFLNKSVDKDYSKGIFKNMTNLQKIQYLIGEKLGLYWILL